MSARRVAVVGGGAVGLTVAHDLAERGAVVELYDRGALGRGSTARAAGIVYDAYTEDVNASLAERSLERFRAWSGERDFRLSPAPYLWFTTEAGASAVALREGAERMQYHGRDVDVVEADAVRREFPVLRADDVEVAAIARDAGVADPAAYADLLAEKAHLAGATLHPDTPASVAFDPPRVNGERYDAVVVAAGVWTRDVLAEAGVSVPLAAYRVQALVADGPAIPILYDADEEFYARPHPAGLLAGDGLDGHATDPDGYDTDADDWFVEATRRRLRSRLINADVPLRRAWAGVCAATPDDHPLLGELADGLYVAAGWRGHGFMRAPAVGERLAQQVLGERDDVGPFDPMRFDGDETVSLPGGE